MVDLFIGDVFFPIHIMDGYHPGIIIADILEDYVAAIPCSTSSTGGRYTVRITEDNFEKGRLPKNCRAIIRKSLYINRNQLTEKKWKGKLNINTIELLLDKIEEGKNEGKIQGLR